MLSGFLALLGVVIGAVLGGLLQLWVDSVRRRSEARTLAASLAAEIESLCGQEISNRLLAFLEIRTFHNQPVDSDAVVEQLCVIYRNNAARLGLLPTNLAAEVAQWYHAVLAWFIALRGYPDVDSNTNLALWKDRSDRATKWRSEGLAVAKKLRMHAEEKVVDSAADINAKVDASKGSLRA